MSVSNDGFTRSCYGGASLLPRKMCDLLLVLVIVEECILTVMASAKPVLSFAELVQGRDASVRVTDDGLADLVDLVMVVTGKNCNHSNELLRNLSHSLFDNENFVMRNQRRYVTLKDAIKLIMVLPGKMAKEMRSQFAEIIEDYIKNNMGPFPASNEQLVGFKRRREELELLKLDEEVKLMTQMRMTSLREEYNLVCTDTTMDERARLLFKDTYMNMLLNSQKPAVMITNGPSSNTPISISGVAATLGYKPTSEDCKRIGTDLRKRYLKQHGKPPTKHDQLCDGRVTSVNSYTEQDRQLVVEALDAYFKPTDDASDAGDN